MLLLFSSCSSGFIGSNTDSAVATASSANTGAKSGYGSLSVTIPAIAAWALSAGGNSKGTASASRALLVADSVTFGVVQGTGASQTTVYSWTETPASTLSPTAGSANSYSSVKTPSVPVGTYTLNVSVFNNSNSTTSPVVTGSAPITIASGVTTPASVVCSPVSPTSLSIGTLLSGQNLGTPWTYSSGTLTTHGAETWYQFTAGSAYTSIAMAHSSGSSSDIPAFGIFSGNGTVLGYTGGNGIQTLAIPTTSGSSYYIAAFDAAGGSTSNGTAVILASKVFQTIQTVVTGSYSPATPIDIAFDTSGDLFISDDGSNVNAIYKVIAGVATIVAGKPGSSGYTGDGGLATSATLNSPHDIAVDSSGNIYIADTGNKAIRMVSVSTGKISTVAGGTGNAGGLTLSSPKGLAFDSSGNLYISDGTTSGAIYKYSPSSGTGTTIATGVSLSSPMGIVLDSSNDLYIADSGNHVIRELISGTTSATTIAGTGTAGYSGDGGLATAAALTNPYGIAFDSAGNLYFADNNTSGNYTSVVREISAGVISTVVGGGASASATAANGITLSKPNRLAVYNGNLYLTDTSNKLIREATP
jgi:streptogramin lyase